MTRTKGPLFVFLLLVALVCGAYLECATELFLAERAGIAEGLVFGVPTFGVVVRLALWLGATFIIAAFFAFDGRRLSWVLRHRYLLALALLIVLVLLEISGSSLALWGPSLGEAPYQGTLFGIPRTDRSDEWLVFTPFSFSQVTTGLNAVSPVIRGGATDVTMVYAQPSWSVATIFRPFLWPYFVLGQAKGLSCFWCARALALVLVTYDCMLLVTKGRTRLAAYAALLVGFSPIVEWWFSVNGTVELLVFGQGLVLALHHLLRTESTAARWGWALLLSWLLGCYALIIYPAWQVTFVYVFGAMGLWDAFMWHKESATPLGATLMRLVPPLLVGLIALAATLGISFFFAREAIQAVGATVYPGERHFTGGGLEAYLPNAMTSLFGALWPKACTPNPCEAAGFVSLFPLGALLAAALVAIGAARRHLDACLVFLAVPYVLLLVYGIVGFPPLLAKITLLSNVMTSRLTYALGYLDVALLIRSFAIIGEYRTTTSSEAHGSERQAARETQLLRAGSHARRKPGHLAPIGATREQPDETRERSWAEPVGAAILLVALVFMARLHNPQLMGDAATVLLVGVLVVLLLPLALPKAWLASAPCGRDSFLLASALVVVVAGLCVNPLQQDAQAVTQSPTLATVRAIAQEDPQALWLTDDSIRGQACIMAGAPTITSVNCYPNLQRWRAIDPDGRFEDAYNRYAHFHVTLGDEVSFANPQPDVCEVTLPTDEVPKLGVTYWLSSQPLEAFGTDTVRFEPVAQVGCGTVYRIVT